MSVWVMWYMPQVKKERDIPIWYDSATMLKLYFHVDYVGERALPVQSL
jgi:hypothetical protein